MTEVAREFQPRLRVAIAAAEATQQTALTDLAMGIASVVVVRADAADVVLSDGSVETEDSAPVVAVGGSANSAAGLLPADASPGQVEAALHAVAAGLRVRIRERGFEATAEAWPAHLLTPREVEVLTAMAKGQSNKEIARQLSISLHTVKFHVESIFRKLGVRSRAEAVARGLQRLEL